MNDAQRCPGNELNKSLSTIDLKCACGAVMEIFSDEANKNHTCSACGASLTVPAENLE